ncbi:DUF461 domain-containing protein [Streptomyces boncukensis]|uniref:DUF461 domain-containing protein n=1 Tax=Streptomyces boncukensis TaxID=2711219 RepID=A0A6G4X419_9ACTN|nr:DUF461 domain-containing protein [Streptomyces boncukensis]
MSSSLRRGTFAATALALAVATLTACGAGNDAQTLDIKPDNAATKVGAIKAQNVNVVTDAEGEEGSGAATVTGRLFNDGKKDQTLRSVTVGSGTRAKLTPAPGEKALTVPAGGSLALGGKGNAAALLTDAEAAGVRNGNAQPVTFDLSRTGEVKLRATVVPARHGHDDVGPSVQPEPRRSAPERDQDAKSGEQDDAKSGEQNGEQNGDSAEGASSPSDSASSGDGEQGGAEGARGDGGAAQGAGGADASASSGAGAPASH